MSDSPVPDEKRRRMRFIPEMNLGQGVTAFISLCGFSFLAMTYAARVDGDHAALDALKLEMSRQFTEVRHDIANLPNVQAEMVQLSRRADQADSRADAQSKRLEEIERVGMQNNSDINTLLRVVGNMQHVSK